MHHLSSFKVYASANPILTHEYYDIINQNPTSLTPPIIATRQVSSISVSLSSYFTSKSHHKTGTNDPISLSYCASINHWTCLEIDLHLYI